MVAIGYTNHERRQIAQIMAVESFEVLIYVSVIYSQKCKPYLVNKKGLSFSEIHLHCSFPTCYYISSGKNKNVPLDML